MYLLQNFYGIESRRSCRECGAVRKEDHMPSLLDMGHFFRRNSHAAEIGSVHIGECFYKPGQRTQIWRVERIFKPAANALTHVVLRRGGDNPETYVISQMALMNPHMFRRDRRDPYSLNVQGRNRRLMDYVREPMQTAKTKPHAVKAQTLESQEDDTSLGASS